MITINHSRILKDFQVEDLDVNLVGRFKKLFLKKMLFTDALHPIWLRLSYLDKMDGKKIGTVFNFYMRKSKQVQIFAKRRPLVTAGRNVSTN